MTNHVDLDTIVLDSGSHRSREDGVCVMEAVAWWAEEEHSDRPKCASRVITDFLMSWNDSLPKDKRQMLKPYIPRVVGTNRGGAKAEEKRAWLATDWLVRECAPAFLRAAGLTAQAELLEGLAPVTTTRRAEKAQPTLRSVRQDASAARDAAWAAAGAAAGDAAWAAAGDAAWAAARAAAGDAARDAAWAAAGDAAWAAAGDAAWDAATRRKAADKALAPTVKALQASALKLLDRMIEVR